MSGGSTFIPNHPPTMTLICLECGETREVASPPVEDCPYCQCEEEAEFAPGSDHEDGALCAACERLVAFDQ